MGTQMNRKAHEALVEEDKAWLLGNSPPCLERDHIIQVLDSSVRDYAPRERSIKTCTHPASQRRQYHDCTVVCGACNCVIEQFGKPLDEPCPLGT